MALTREQILAVPRGQPVREVVPEWGGDVFLKPLTARDMHRITTESADSPDQLPVLVASLVDEAGAPLFTLADAEALRAMDAAPIVRLLARVRKLNGLTDDGPKA